jgi:TatD DNase family protein
LSKDNGVFLFNNRFGSDTDMYTGKYFSAGIHPWDANLQVSISELEKLIQHSNCLAIGECGLDKVVDLEFELQKKIFIVQLDLAVNYQKPVIIHCVKAYDELMEICKSYHHQIPLIIHGYNKSLELAKQLIDKGFFLSFSQSFLKKEGIDFTDFSLSKIFLETDDNESIMIETIYQKAADRFKIKEDHLKEKIYFNFTTIFNTHGR